MSEKTTVPYRELLESVSKYNSRLLQERRARIPYHDPSTNVDYYDGRRLYVPLERGPGVGTGQIISYPSRRWKLRPRPPPVHTHPPVADMQFSSLPAAVTSAEPGVLANHANSNGMCAAPISSDSSNSMYPPADCSNSVTGTSALKVFEDSFASSRDSWNTPDVPGEMISSMEGSESNDHDFDTDDDNEDGGRKRKGSAKNSKQAGKARKDVDYTVVVGADKPYCCNYCDMCYKTRPGLTYHVTKEHPSGGRQGRSPGAQSQQQQSHPSHATAAHQSLPHFSAHQFHYQSASPSAHKTAVLMHPNADKSLQRDREGKSLICDFCEVDNPSTKLAPKGEKLISCASCGHSAHPACLGFTKNQRESTRQYPWKCIECKSCSFCNSAENDEKLLFCDDCDRGYHMYCLNPSLETTPEGPWSCDACLMQYGEEAAFSVWKRKMQQEAVAKYQREMEESARRASGSSGRQRHPAQLDQKN